MTRFALGRKCGAGSAPCVVPAVRSRGSSAPRASPPRPRLAVERKWRRVRASGSSGAVGFIAVILGKGLSLHDSGIEVEQGVGNHRGGGELGWIEVRCGRTT